MTDRLTEDSAEPIQMDPEPLRPHLGLTDEGGPGHVSRMARNLVFSWAGQVVSMVAGFVLPRSTDRNLGQAGLGVWDLGWSIVSYFGMAQLGLSSSVDRYVAKYRGERDDVGLSRMVSSALVAQSVVASVVVLVAIGASLNVHLVRADLGPLLDDARWVVLLLGSTIALQIAFTTFDGVITGSHRWDLHNAIEAGGYGIIVCGMLASQWMGYGLRAMATVYFAGSVLTEIVRTVVAFHICPELRVGASRASWAEVKEMYHFGGKVFVGVFAGRLVYQTNSILIAHYLGPAVLALYSRPLALVLLVSTFVGKLSHMLTPLASQLDATRQLEEVRRLMRRASESSAFIALPPLAFLCIMGGPLLRIWMGDRYATGAFLLALLALGHAASFVHRPVPSIMIGVDAHGSFAVGSLVTAVSSVVFCALALGYAGGGLESAALAIGVPMTIFSGVYLPWGSCKHLGMPFLEYMVSSWKRPLLFVAPFVAVLLATRVAFRSPAGLAAGSVVAGLALFAIYWRFVIPDTVKTSVLRRISLRSAS
jgi:O-antigen/teichoic acid export membrane protein